MLALVARPIRCLWDQPLRHRRSIGIFAFAATLTHAIYAFLHALDGNLQTILSVTSGYQWGIWAGIISLAAITPAAVTSFPSLQKKLGKRWRQIHLLTVPALAFASFHIVLIGPHYMAQIHIEVFDYLRISGIMIMTLFVFIIREPKKFWSILKLKK